MPSEVCGLTVKAQHLRVHEKGVNMLTSVPKGALLLCPERRKTIKRCGKDHDKTGERTEYKAISRNNSLPME